MFVPGWNESMFAMARISVSCTKSSARSTLPQSEMANARKLGTAASIASRTDDRIVMISTPCCRMPWPPTRRLGSSSPEASPRGRLGVATVLRLVELLQQVLEAVGNALPQHLVVDALKDFADP